MISEYLAAALLDENGAEDILDHHQHGAKRYGDHS